VIDFVDDMLVGLGLYISLHVLVQSTSKSQAPCKNCDTVHHLRYLGTVYYADSRTTKNLYHHTTMHTVSMRPSQSTL
jgi:hypothetical protein